MENLKKLRHENMSSRKTLVASLRQKYPDRLPIIVDRATTQDPVLPKNKFIIESTCTMGTLIAVIRKHLILPSGSALFFYTDSQIMVPVGALIGDIYKQYRNEDGFLYIIYTLENTFGSQNLNDTNEGTQ